MNIIKTFIHNNIHKYMYSKNDDLQYDVPII